jgi:hypothetical protein
MNYSNLIIVSHVLRRFGETPPTFLQKNEFLEIPNNLFVCLSAKCRRDARDPLVSPAFQDRRYFVYVPSGSQAKRLHPRIAGVSPASGCTQPPMNEVLLSTALSVAYRQHAGETPAIRWSRLHFRIAGISPGFL